MDSVPEFSEKRPFQFTLRTLLLIMTGVAFVLGLSFYLHCPEIAGMSLVGVPVWILWRYGKANILGVVLWLILVEFLVWAGFASTYRMKVPQDWFKPAYVFLICIAIPGGLIILVVFILAACKSEINRFGNLCGICLTIALPLLWYIVVCPITDSISEQLSIKQTAENNAAMSEAIKQVEALCSKLGRTPSDKEFLQISGKPLPVLHFDHSKCEISYYREDDKYYRLEFFYWDKYVYENKAPQNGWRRIPF
jgi:hypothetical protein